LVLVLFVTLALAAFFSWQNLSEQRSSLQRIEQVTVAQQHDRLKGEMRSAVDYLDFLRSQADQTLRQSAVSQVDFALNIAQTIHARESGNHPPEVVQRLILDVLRPLRFFDGRGYYFATDMQGRILLQPSAPQMEGQNGLDNRDDTGHFFIRGLIDAARQPDGEGFSNYRWYRPDQPTVMADKIAYVRHFAPYDWLIGTGDYTYEWDKSQQQAALVRLRNLRFGATGTIAALDAQGRPLLLPNTPWLEGKSPTDLSPSQRTVTQRLLETAQHGGGFVNYEWIDPRTGRVGQKTALVQAYAPWGWTMVVTVFNDELQATLDAEISAQERGNARRRWTFAGVVAGALLIGLLGSLGFSRWSGELFRRYHAQRQRAEADQRIAAIAFESQEGMFVTDANSTILRVNRPFTAITGYTAQEAIGQTPALLKSGQHGQAFYDAMWSTLATEGAWRGEIFNRRKNGAIFPEWLTITAVKADDGQVTHYVCTLTDNTQRKTDEQAIRQLAFYDGLTRLPNRRLLMDRLQQALASSLRKQNQGAVMFIDLDNFKLVNDTLGHHLGDLLLQDVAHRLQAAVRESDTVARLGGDEFVVMLEELSSDREEAASHAQMVADKILSELGKSCHLDGHDINITCSIGVTLFSAQPAEDLMKQADLAMYQAKNAGKNTVRFFDPQMQAAVMQRVAMETDLRAALQRNELRLYYQAQVDGQGQLLGAEALVRWQHPTRGLVSPGEFIGLAEESGLILPLGLWVLERACEQLADWAQHPDRAHLTLAVNVSGSQLRRPDFVAQVLAVLASTGAPPTQLKLELTESLLLENKEDTILKMSALKASGVRFSLDDFGTGYSSLAYLKRLPLDQLKIDQSFVQDIVSEPRDAAIVRTIVSLADSLGLQVVAEGVETTAQRDSLAQHGCHTYQGYLYSRPGPVNHLFQLDSGRTG
jgi:diguanylate cyclase (GGDEF)-like protein/PAS domain S-box-containing protein